jgi:hypothetical protein
LTTLNSQEYYSSLETFNKTKDEQAKKKVTVKAKQNEEQNNRSVGYAQR